MSPSDIQIEVFGKTDVGLIREHNEDNLLVADLGGSVKESSPTAPVSLKLGDHGALFVVCDGMGGAAAGEVASQMAVETIFDSLAASDPRSRHELARGLRRAVEAANVRIFQQSRDNQNERGMGTTCTAAGLIDDTLVIAQIGDSRCYILRDGKLAQVTKDQSLAWQLIEAGAMTPEDAKAFEHANIILQALGVQDRVEVAMSQVSLRRGDVMVLCSDGLHGPVSDLEIEEVLTSEPDLQKVSEALLQKALERDGPDNITVVLARFDGAGLAAPSAGDLVAFVGYEGEQEPLPVVDATVRTDAALGADRENSDDATVAAVPESETTQETDPSLAKPVVTGRRLARAPGGHTAEHRAAERWASETPPRGTQAGSHSMMAFFFLALLAAAAGGIVVLKCERDQAIHSEGPRPGP